MQVVKHSDLVYVAHVGVSPLALRRIPPHGAAVARPGLLVATCESIRPPREEDGYKRIWLIECAL